MFSCCGKVTSDFIISKRCAGWSAKGDPIPQRCADQPWGPEKPARLFAHTASCTGNGWYQRDKAASVGPLEKLLGRRQHNARNFPVLCGLGSFRSFFFLFLNLSLVKKWPIAHMSGGKSINVWQVNTDPSSKYSPSTHSVCGKKSHTFTV